MREVLAEGRFLRLVREQGWEHAERTNAHGVVLIVAVTDAGQMLLCEQFRRPVNAYVIELPAGLAGDDVAGEPLALAAGRELVEETGYEATTVTYLTAGPSSAGMSNETATMFLARGLRKVTDGGGVEGESIVTHLVDLADVPAFLDAQMRDGKQVDTKVWSALWFAANR